MALTHVNAVPFLAESSADVFENMDMSGGTVCDATNGNYTENNGSLLLFVTATATDGLVITLPELPDRTVPLVNGSMRFLGKFEADQYGPTVQWKGLATTKVLPVQFAELP
jgi:hypothetical protein